MMNDGKILVKNWKEDLIEWCRIWSEKNLDGWTTKSFRHQTLINLGNKCWYIDSLDNESHCEEIDLVPVPSYQNDIPLIWKEKGKGGEIVLAFVFCKYYPRSSWIEKLQKLDCEKMIISQAEKNRRKDFAKGIMKRKEELQETKNLWILAPFLDGGFCLEVDDLLNKIEEEDWLGRDVGRPEIEG